MSNGFTYVVDAHLIDKIEEKKILDPSACALDGQNSHVSLTNPAYILDLKRKPGNSIAVTLYAFRSHN